MKRLFSIFVFIALAPLAWAQFTNVTGTVVDPDAVPYAFGTISATLQTSASPTLNGLAYSPPTQPAGLDGTGKFLMRLADNTQLLPAGTKWGFTICSAVGTVSPAFGTASQCFTVAPITISGSSQDITATITAVPVPRLTVPFGAGGGTVTTNPVGGCATTNSLAKFTAATVIGCSSVLDNGTHVTDTTEDLQISGTPVAATFNSITNNSLFHGFYTSTQTSGNAVTGYNQVGVLNPAGASSNNYYGYAADLETPAANAQNFSANLAGYYAVLVHNGSGNLTYGGAVPGLSGFVTGVIHLGSGTISQQTGYHATSVNQGSGNITTNSAYKGISGFNNAGTGTTTQDITFLAAVPGLSGSGGTMTHHYAFLAQKGHTGGTSNPDGWAFHVQNSSGGDRSQFGPLYLMTLSLGDFPAGGPIGTAATTVDIYPSINIAQTTAGQTLTLPSPTLATAGNILEINNTGSASFTMLGATVAATQSLQAMWNGTAWSPVGGTAVGTINAASQFSLPYYSAAGSANTLSGVAGPTTPNGVPQFWVTTPSGGVATAPAPQLAGVPTNAQTGASYTYVATDRASYVSFSNAGAIAVTLPQAGSAGFGSNFVNVSCDIGAGTATITPTISTISYTNGSTYTSGAATLPLTTGQCATIYSDNTNYFAIVRAGAAASTTINPTNNVIPKRSNATTFVDSALTDNGTNVTSSEAVLFPAGTASLPGIAFSAQANTGFWRAGSGVFDFSNAGTTVFELGGALAIKSSTVLGFTSGDPSSQPIDTSLSRVSAGLFAFGNGSAADTTATIKFKAGRSDSNCQNSGGTCGSAMSGMVTIAAGATTVTVATTAITTNAEVFLQEDSSLGTQLGVTCNTAVARSYQITTRTSGTSFVITSSAAPITNPACLQYFIWNTGS